MSEAARQRDFLEPFSADVVKHPVRNHGPQIRIARTEVEVEPSVVVEVTEVAAHGEDDLVGEARARRDVLERSVSLVAVETRLLRLCRLAVNVLRIRQPEVFA